MNRNIWVVAGLAVLALAGINVILGLNLVPVKAVAEERGVVAGWWLVWTLIALTVVSAIALGWFLLAAGLGRVPETAD
jgi:hypothetical protein